MRLALLLVLLLFVAGAAVIGAGLWRPPPRWDPFAPLDLAAEPNLVTGLKLVRLQGDPQACLAAFEASGLAPARVPGRPIGEDGCGYGPVALRLSATAGAALVPPGPVASCPLAAAWVLFERHTLQPAARRHLGSDVVRVRHLGTYACRNVNHAASGRRSQHATANALDIAGFTLRDGRDVTLLRHWDSPGPEGAFLREVRDGACRWFRAVLGPDYNQAHRDHFHFDRGPWSACR